MVRAALRQRSSGGSRTKEVAGEEARHISEPEPEETPAVSIRPNAETTQNSIEAGPEMTQAARTNQSRAEHWDARNMALVFGGHPDVLDALEPGEVVSGSHYFAMKTLPDGRRCGVVRLIYHFTMHVDINEIGYEDRYCYRTLDGALRALADWDGEGDPEGWHRNPKTGRRRDAEGNEWVEW